MGFIAGLFGAAAVILIIGAFFDGNKSDDVRGVTAIIGAICIAVSIGASSNLDTKDPETKEPISLEKQVSDLQEEVTFLRNKDKYVAICEEYRHFTDFKAEYSCGQYTEFAYNGNLDYMTLGYLEMQVKIMRKVKRLK